MTRTAIDLVEKKYAGKTVSYFSVKFSNLPANTLSADMRDSISKAFRMVAQMYRDEPRYSWLRDPNDKMPAAVLLYSDGGKFFSAGADLAEIYAAIEDGEEALRMFARSGHNLMDEITRCELPVFAFIQGYALGGGLELALAAHCRVVTEDAVIGLPEVNLDIIPGWGGTVHIMRLIERHLVTGRYSLAHRLFLSVVEGRKLSAQEALELGLVNAVAPPAADPHDFMAQLLASGMYRGAAVTHNPSTPTREASEREIEAFVRKCLEPSAEEKIAKFLKKNQSRL